MQELIREAVDITPVRPGLVNESDDALDRLANFYQRWKRKPLSVPPILDRIRPRDAILARPPEAIAMAADTPRAARRSWPTGWLNGLSSAALVMMAVGAWYAWEAAQRVPSPSSPIGLALGIIGLACMLGAETLYSIRKRVRGWSRGRMSTWLQSHIFMGLVGPFLALLHAAGKFHGIAGAAAGVMLVIVASGLVGRFLYTAAPRTLDGVEIDACELLTRFAEVKRQLQGLGYRLSTDHLADLGLTSDTPGWLAVFGRQILLWQHGRRARQLVAALRLPTNSTMQLKRLLAQRFALQLDICAVAAARRWLAWWHALHVPLGLVLFTLAVQFDTGCGEPDLLDALAAALREEGYAVDTAADGVEGLFKAQSWDYDAVVLDLMLPGLDGCALLERLRQDKKTPVLILTARDSVLDRVRGLDLGADDYLVKPFALSELLARLRALIRRAAGHASAIVQLGDLTLDTVGRTLSRSGEQIHLTAREYALLELLVLHRGKVVTRTMIYEHLFDEEDDSLSNLVDVHVSNLR